MSEHGRKVKLLNIRQAAKVVEGLTEYRIRQLCRSGELPCIQAGRKILLNEQALIDYVLRAERRQSHE